MNDAFDTFDQSTLGLILSILSALSKLCQSYFDKLDGDCAAMNIGLEAKKLWETEVLMFSLLVKILLNVEKIWYRIN